jgi:hypothetical protein
LVLRILRFSKYYEPKISTSYLFQSLGLARTAEVQRDARIGEADAHMTTIIKEAIASEELTQAKLLNDTEIARYDDVSTST